VRLLNRIGCCARRLLDEPAVSLHNADCVFVAVVVAARMAAADDGWAAVLASRSARQGLRVRAERTGTRFVAALGERVRTGDVVVLLGAGDMGNWTDELVGRLSRHRAAG
jgi:UDP-N-acetylmuramate-alanine ligase